VRARRETPLPPGLSYDDLPLWMRQARRRVDWGLILVLLLGLLSVWPLITRGGLPRGTGLELYVYRTAEMADIIHEGVAYPRWASNLLYGYGLPLFNYTAPGSVYPAAVFSLLTESTPVDGVRSLLIVAALAGAGGMYAFVRRRWGAVAGLTSAGLFTLSPPLLFILPYVEGDLALIVALQITPAVFWAADRVLYHGGRGFDVGLLAGLTAILLLADERAGPYLFLLLAGWGLWLGLFDRRRAYGMMLLGIVLGSGMAAIFWLPALAEQALVHWVPAVQGNPRGALTLQELLTPTAIMDFGGFQPAAVRNLGLPLWMLAVIAAPGQLIVVWRDARHARRALQLAEWWLYFALAAAVLIGLVASHSLPGLPDAAVPGLLAIPLTVMAGRATLWLDSLGPRRERLRHAGLALLVSLPLLGAYPLLHPPDWRADFGPTDALARLQLELNDYGLGTVPVGGDIPLPGTTVPEPSRPLVESYVAGQVDKVNRTTFGSEGRVDVIEHDAALDRLLVAVSQPVRISLYISAFPGWNIQQGSLNLDWTSDPEGFLNFDARAGVHEVAVFYGETPLQLTADAIAIAMFLLTVAMSVLRSRRAGFTPTIDASLLATAETRVVAFALGFLVLALPALVGQAGLFWQQSPRGVVLGDSQPLQHYSRLGLDILSYRLDNAVVTPGESIELTLYWRTVRPLADNLQVTVNLVDAGTGRRVAQSYKRHLGGYPTTRWPSNRYVRDVHRLSLSESVPPGNYLLQVEVWDCASAALEGCQADQRLEFFEAYGSPVGRSLVLPVLVNVLP
jgi:hypothetical protein